MIYNFVIHTLFVYVYSMQFPQTMTHRTESLNVAEIEYRMPYIV